MAYFMLQTVDEFDLSANVYNEICLRMAANSYANNMQFGRVTFWCCKCKTSAISKQAFDKYLGILLRLYLDEPSLHINSLHDVCDNAAANIASECHLFSLLSKLRNMHLCREDLQTLDATFNAKSSLLMTASKKQHKKVRMIKPSPFTTSRGHLIAALSKPHNEKNKNLKNMADSFYVIIEYPKLKKNVAAKKKLEETASRDFILKHLVTPPRPTPSRSCKSSHRKSFGSLSSRKEKVKEKLDFLNRSRNNAMNADEESQSDESDEENDGMSKEEKQYMFECCEIIASFMSYLVDILNLQLYETAHLVKILMFSLQMLSHQYSPNAISLNDVLLITHKWLQLKFMKNKKSTEIEKFDKNHELKHLQTILSHLQAKVLTTTYSGKNYGAQWKRQAEEQAVRERQQEDDDGDDIIDID